MLNLNAFSQSETHVRILLFGGAITERPLDPIVFFVVTYGDRRVEQISNFDETLIPLIFQTFHAQVCLERLFIHLLLQSFDLVDCESLDYFTYDLNNKIINL